MVVGDGLVVLDTLGQQDGKNHGRDQQPYSKTTEKHVGRLSLLGKNGVLGNQGRLGIFVKFNGVVFLRVVHLQQGGTHGGKWASAGNRVGVEVSWTQGRGRFILLSKKRVLQGVSSLNCAGP